jgi:hypothetical protein
MQNYAGERVLRIGVHGTAGQAGRLDAVIASHRQMQPLGVRIPAALNFTYSPPVDIRGIPVLLVASHNTTFATNTFGHVEMKAVLLARQESTLGDARCLGSERCPAMRCPTGTRPGLRGQEEVGTLFVPFF